MSDLTAAEAKAIAGEAWAWGLAPVILYETMYSQAVDAGSPGYVGGFNVFRHYDRLFTSDDRDIRTPNNDTPYSWAWLDGGKSYRLRLPAGIPVNNFWSVTVYDADTRSLLQNGEPKPSISSFDGPQGNADGSVELLFGPEAPAEGLANWIRTVPGRGWFPYFRFYAATEAYFDKSWQLNDIDAI